MSKLKDLISYFEELVDSKANNLDYESSQIEIFNSKGIGYSQFNEILLLLGFKRVSYEFFQYLADGRYEYLPETSINSLEQLEDGINRFIVLALLFYGNIRFAYKELSSNSNKLYEVIGESLPTEIDLFRKRHDVIRNINEIPPDKTYFLGYIIEGELKKRIIDNPHDEEAKRLEEERKEFVKIAESNQIVYLSSDHLDVYVATSMRAKHDFLFVNRTIREIFSDDSLKELNLRYFDPTQAYCLNRIDKGLSEALMLKTALCTLYLAQESETLGKDSELASTLAQGKAVIAYIPHGDKKFVDELMESLIINNPERSESELLIEQLMIFNPSLVWKDAKIRDWLNEDCNASILEMKEQLYKLAENYYNKRANTLKDDHPLGIQVNLNSGVANGVLVVRTIDDCIKLIRNVVLNEMGFNIEKEPNGQKGYIYLKEEISDGIFRLKTGDTLLTSTFWNFYTKN